MAPSDFADVLLVWPAHGTKQTEIDCEFDSQSYCDQFPLRRDFTASVFDAKLERYEFGLHFGPVLVDVPVSLLVGKRVAYRAVMRDGNFIDRRASLARALTLRAQCRVAHGRGLPVGGVY